MKKLFALILAGMMLLSMMACAAPAAAPAPEAPAAPAETAAEAPAEPEAPADGPVMAKIKSSGKLVVGTEAQYAPYEFKDLNADFAGCDMWLAQKIADSMGVTLEIVDMGFDGIIPAVQSGQVDMGIAAFTYTEERAQVIDFSNQYEQSPQLMLVKKGNEGVYTSVDSVKGLKIGAQKGTIQSQLIMKVFPESELFELDKYPELALEVTQGNIAALVVDSAVGEALIASNADLVAANYEFDPNDANFGKAIVMAQGNEDLVAATNLVVDAVVADGSYLTAFEEAKTLAASLGL